MRAIRPSLVTTSTAGLLLALALTGCGAGEDARPVSQSSSQSST